jgi:hypothetical protein
MNHREKNVLANKDSIVDKQAEENQREDIIEGFCCGWGLPERLSKSYDPQQKPLSTDILGEHCD